MLKNHTQHIGGGSEYLTPDLHVIDIAVEKGFADSSQLPDNGFEEWPED